VSTGCSAEGVLVVIEPALEIGQFDAVKLAYV
jgi:hypothetical protein